MKLKYDIDYSGLEIYLRSLKIDEIETNWRNPINPKLVQGEAMDDIEFFNLSIDDINKNKIIEYGEPFLVDALGNDLSILILSRRKHKLPNGRVVRCKFVTTIIEDCRSLYGTPLNGYWKIPKQFINKN